MFEHGRQCGVRRADACGARRAYLRGCRATPRISRTMVPLSATTSSAVAKRNAFLAALFLAILAVENTASMLARLRRGGHQAAVQQERGARGERADEDGIQRDDDGAPHPELLHVPAELRGEGRAGALREHLRRVAKHSPRMAVPTVVYLVVNLISYPALERINASVFTAISQLKVLATAFFAVLMLGTPVSGASGERSPSWCSASPSCPSSPPRPRARTPPAPNSTESTSWASCVR